MTSPARQKKAEGRRATLAAVVGIGTLSAVNLLADPDGPVPGLLLGVLAGAAVWLLTGLIKKS